MSMIREISRAFFVAFGFFESVMNLFYLIRKDGIMKARKQHKELPEAVSDVQMTVKVICMLISGMLFFTTGILSYIFHTYFQSIFVITAGIFVMYAVAEACYYRYWKTYGFAGVSLLLCCLLWIN